MKIVAIDIGGTEIKYSLLDVTGKILHSNSILTEASKGVQQLLEKIYSIVEEYKNENTLIGIAVSATGQIDGINGIVIGGTDLIPGWIGTNLVEILESKYQLPAILENDVNCAAVGEMWKGAGKGADDFLCLTIGTGIGGGIVLNKNLYRGPGYVAGEFGHIQIEKKGKLCGCGNRGCYQQYASTTALIEMIENQTGKTLNGKEIFNAVKNTGAEYKEIVDKWCDYLTDGLATLTYIFNPSLIIIGGGVSKQGDYLKEMIENSLKNKIGPNYKKTLHIKMAEKGNEAGVLGAAYLLLDKIKRDLI